MSEIESKETVERKKNENGTDILEEKSVDGFGERNVEENSLMSDLEQCESNNKSSEKSGCQNILKTLRFRDSKLGTTNVVCTEANQDSTGVLEFQEKKDLKKTMLEFEERTDDEPETKKQEKTIENLYEALKQTTDAFFAMKKPEETTQLVSKSIQQDKNGSNGSNGPQSVQQIYDKTLLDIYQVWMDTVGLVKSVRDHAILYVEKLRDCNGTIDREQMTLEGEMVQLAVDFAVNYSKHKTDFLLKKVRKLLHVKEWEKSELENFMDSKLLPTAYSLEDLATMAKTVQELNLSVVKGEDYEIE